MADLAAGISGYEGELDTGAAEADGEKTDRLKFNGILDAVKKMQAEMGIEPAGGTLTDIKTFLQIEHASATGKHTNKFPLAFTQAPALESQSAVELCVAGHRRAITGSVVWDPGSLNDGVGETKSITVSGAAFGDFVFVSAPYDLQDMLATAYIQAANTVEIRLQNESGGVLDLGSGTWRVKVIPYDENISGIAVGEKYHVTPWGGSVVGISVASLTARSAGTLTVDATINGAVTGLQAVLDGTNVAYHYANQALAQDTFSAGDLIGVKITTDASWSGSSDISVIVFVSFN